MTVFEIKLMDSFDLTSHKLNRSAPYRRRAGFGVYE